MRHILFVFPLLLATAVADAGGGPANVAVVVNSDSAVSRRIANEYVSLRGIPPGNVIHLANVPATGSVSFAQFRERLLGPVLQVLDQRGLAAQIDCLVWSDGFPHRVRLPSDVTAQRLSHVPNDAASITGLTYLYTTVLEDRPLDAVHMEANAYARRPLPAQEDVPWTLAEAKLNDSIRKSLGEASLLVAKRYANDKDSRRVPPLTPEEQTRLAEIWSKAVPSLEMLVQTHPKEPGLWYNLACARAQTGSLDQAEEALGKAIDAGWYDAWHTRSDLDLVPLRERKSFQKLLERTREVDIRLQPTTGFRGRVGWNRRGERVPPEQGPRYLLSALLSVTGDQGLTVDESVRLLRQAVEAEQNLQNGTFYFMLNEDIRSKVREWAVPSVVRELRRMGLKAEERSGVLPENCADVAGLLVGAASFSWADSGSSILPGSLCEHLTSFGGAFNGSGQTKLTEFLRHGAAGATGTVAEPMSIQAKFPDAFVQVHYARGVSLAEAVYQSVRCPYQLLVVGDPLCQPYAQRPTLEVPDLQAGQVVEGEVTVTVQVGDEPKVRVVEVFFDGRLVGAVPPGNPWTMNSAQAPDGWHELRFSAVAEGLLETRRDVVLPIVFSNRERACSLQALSPGSVSQTAEVAVRVDAGAQATKLLLLHQARVVAEAEPDDQGGAEFTVAAALLGAGPVQLQAAAEIPGEPGPVLSPPVFLQINPVADGPSVTQD